MDDNIREINVHDDVKVGANEGGVLEATFEGIRVGMRVFEGEGLSGFADSKPDGSIADGVHGKSPQGERDSLKACRILIERLNQEGAQLGELKRPDGPEQGIDCVAYDQRDQKKLEIQVTRALSKEQYWSQLANSPEHHIEGIETADRLADDLWKAINKKTRLAPTARSGVVLAIIAVFPPSHSFDLVATLFRRRYGEVARTFGFQEIWVVGPTAETCSRIDSGT